MKKLNSNICLAAVAALWMAVGLSMVSGCASLNKSECINADWKSIGYEDGARGYKASRIGRHRKACAKHGVAPDFDVYESGRRQGLLEWCTPRNGYRLGTQGKIYNGVCPAALAPAFEDALNQGRALHAYEKEVKKEEIQLKEMMAELDALTKEIHVMESDLVSDGVSPRRRMKLLEEIRRLEADQRYLETDIANGEQTLEDMRENLQRMRAENPYKF